MIYPVFDKKQALYIYSLSELLNMQKEDRLILRETNKVHMRHIRSYIIENYETNNVYLPPLVAVIRDGNLQEEKPKSLEIIDGSHRLQALLSMPTVVEKNIYSSDPQKSKHAFALRYSFHEITMAIQVYEGLSEQEASQLYLDLNTRGKKVSLSKRIAYDSRDEINLTTNRLLQTNKNLQIAGIETEKAAIVRPKNKNFMSLSQLRNIVGIFITGKDVESKLSIKMEKDTNFQDALVLVEVWLEELFKLYPPHKIGDYEISMLASYPLQLALVHYVLEGTQNETMEQKQQIIQQRMQRLKDVDWNRKQDIWQRFSGTRRGKEQYFYLTKDKKSIQSIVKWLKSKGGE